VKKVALFASAIALAALAAPASAAVTTGGRVEGIIGWDRGVVDLEDFGADERLKASGIVYGVGVGYDFAFGQTASFGIDLEASDATTDMDLTDGVDSAELSIGRDLYVGGRITTALSDNVNLYFKAGYTNARIKGTTDIGGVVTSESANADGARGGVGVQFGFGANTYIGGEYRYSNYEADFSRHQAVGTLGFRF
jgi:outer membrane immunogenic protein